MGLICKWFSQKTNFIFEKGRNAYMTTFERIKIIAKEKGMSLLEVNSKANLGKNVIYGWKSKDPNTESLKKVAKVLGVSTDRLLGNADNSQKHEVDLTDDDVIFTYEGRKIPKEDLEMIKRFMRGK